MAMAREKLTPKRWDEMSDFEMTLPVLGGVTNRLSYLITLTVGRSKYET